MMKQNIRVGWNKQNGPARNKRNKKESKKEALSYGKCPLTALAWA